MNYSDPDLRERLAADYVLGTMPWRARSRFEAQLKLSPQLRRAVADWEGRLTPLAAALPEMTPPARIWRAIQARLHPTRRPKGLWSSLAVWRAATAFAAAAVIALGLLMVAPDKQPPQQNLMVVVMNDTQTRTPAMTVSWKPGGELERVLRLRVIGHAEMSPDTAWELWLLPGGDRPPVSLGLITTHELQTVLVPKPLAAGLDQAWGLGMSVEPRGGSPTGRPTSSMLYAGQCVKT